MRLRRAVLGGVVTVVVLLLFSSELLIMGRFGATVSLTVVAAMGLSLI